MRSKFVSLVGLVVIFCAAQLHAAEFKVKPGSPNEVVFTSKAITEEFQGRTDQMTGSIVVDPAGVGDSILVHIEVDLASLDSGLGKRDQHMRDNHLETKKYPKAVFDGATVTGGDGAALTADDPATFEVEGSFTLHGVTRRLHTTVEVRLKDPGTLEFKTDFPVALADHNISRPKFLFLKLAEVQQVSVTGTATLAGSN